MFTTEPSLAGFNEMEYTRVPLLPISAQGGSLNDFVVSVSLQDCEKIISPIKGADIAITISGDSMADEYPNGSIVLAKRINERAFIDWGKVYVLDTCNGVVVKTLTPSEKYENINSFRPCFDIKWTSKHRSKDQGSNSLHLYWSQGKEVPRNTNLPWAQQVFGQHQAAFREQRKGKRVYPLQDMLQVKRRI